MTTRSQLERVIVYQAVCEKAAHDQAEFFIRKLDNERATCDELRRERAALLAENAELRADVESKGASLEQLRAEVDRLRVELKDALNCADVAERRFASIEVELDQVRETSVDRAREIMNLRAELKRAKGRKR